MQAATLVDRPARALSWPGRVLSGIVIAFMVFDGVIHILHPAPVVDAFTQLAFPLRLSIALGVIELLCTVLYAIPRTAFIGALLLTAYLGGAVAVQLRAESAWFPDIFPVIVGALLWAGLALRDRQVRRLFV
jgi:hypothetical protein